ncbi:hypothetical protein [Anaerotruncus massiliensis (ex Togo et al. 2019)]|mgnify:CR=1 FL=1|jgi:hypothetical protein|nr:hypothetical protein [Anaerotruncus massiliensis (ex Togo et al. 2019)]GKH45834.1 hypothetical protein CE91St45_03960 [Oscillospiraceae bacterium]
MEIPGEGLISTAIEQVVAGVQIKVSQIEESRNREFLYQMKELEFYKSNYEKDLKGIFDYWFDVVRITHIKDNLHLTEQERQKYNKKFSELVYVDKIAQYKMNTLKYGGRETGRILALQNKLQQKFYDDKPRETELYLWCRILAVLKKDILGQDLDPLDILRVLVNDYDEHEKEIIAAKNYVDKIYAQTYGKP